MSQLFILKDIRNDNNIFSLDTYCQEKSPETNTTNNIFFFKDLDREENNKDSLHLNDNSIQKGDFLESKYDLSNDISSLKFFNNNLSTQTQAVSLNENNKNEKDIKKHFLNKISARKSRQKKKEYIKYLEEELVKLKNNSLNKKINNKSNINYINENEIDDKNKKFFNNIILIEKHGKEINKDGQKKKANLMKEYEVLQKILLKEMLIRQINYFIPLKFQIFGEKYIKLLPICEDDSISVIKTKINENLNKIENYNNNVSKRKIKFLTKFYETYQKINNYIDNFQKLFNENF